MSDLPQEFDLKFLPDWLKEAPAGNPYADYEGDAAALRRAATAVGRAAIGLKEIAPAAPSRVEIVHGMAAPRIGATIRVRLRNPGRRSRSGRSA